MDEDWLEVVRSDEPNEPVKFTQAGDALDDVVGPMINRQVTVTAVRRKDKLLYLDIESVE